jgi:hypothetical protein
MKVTMAASDMPGVQIDEPLRDTGFEARNMSVLKPFR